MFVEMLVLQTKSSSPEIGLSWYDPFGGPITLWDWKRVLLSIDRESDRPPQHSLPSDSPRNLLCIGSIEASPSSNDIRLKLLVQGTRPCSLVRRV